MASRNIFLPKESNRRIPNGTYGGVRGMNNLYSIAFPRAKPGCEGFCRRQAAYKNSSPRSGDTTPSEPVRWKRAEPFEPSEPEPQSGSNGCDAPHLD